MNPHESVQKLTPAHLARKAIVYLRQSSLQQVRQNKESQRLQYALADKAKALGFNHVEVIDCDLGVSAAPGARPREGFKQLLASVAMGDVGIVLSRELSRLSRTDKDWCHLLELCQLFNILIADADNLYDLNLLDDQLVLGIKGTLSVVELKVLKLRLLQGMQEKAKRGELVRLLAPGYVCDLAGQIVKDPNLRVQEAIELVFKKFRDLGSIRQTYRWFHEENIELPVNKALGGRFQLIWKLPAHSFVSDVLHNPLYAGAYVYGRRPSEVVVKAGQVVKRQGCPRPAEAASVFIQDHHPSYISWADYQRNQQLMRGNAGNFDRDESVMAVRAGHGLLTGLLRCARCGRKLHIRYWGKHGTAARYLCDGEFPTGGRYCLGFGGLSVDKRVSEQILRALSPLGVAASVAAIEQLNAQDSDRGDALARQLQQFEFEAQRAFDQYNQADPANRLQEAIELVFKKFRDLGSIRQTYRWFHEENIELPVNKALGGRFQLIWKLPAHSFVSDVLHNPLYAGAYVYGRRPSEVVVKAGQVVKRQGCPRPAEAASVFIQDHHPSYISWADYQRNQQLMRGNAGNFDRDESVMAVRAGHGLLTGLLRCARCGRKLHIRYWGKHGTAARYLCDGEFPTGGRYCLGFGGLSVDKRVSEQILRALSPLGVAASVAAIEQLNAQDSDRGDALARQLQQFEFEAQRAFDQYNQADPANRLVAEVLEQRWNEKLEAVDQLKIELDSHHLARRSLSRAEKDAMLALGENFASVWNDPSCSMVLKKRIARTLINEIIVGLDKDTQQLHFIIHWHGGCHTPFEMPKPLSGAIVHKTSLEDLELITHMARRYRDHEIARVLSKLGRQTGKGNRWTQSRVAFVRKKYALPTPEEAKLDPNILTLGQATKYCGVSDTTLKRLIHENILAVEQVAPYAPLEINRADLDSEPVASILERLKATGKLILEGDTLGLQRCLFESHQ